jgi:hypothetical protein
VTEQQNRLAAELEFYKLNEAEWLQRHSGQYVVLKGSEVLGFYPAFSDAYTAGASAWGAGTDFLVKQILAYEPVFSVF